MSGKRIVYTSLPNYVRLNKKKYIVKDYSVLPIYRWAQKRIIDMKGQEVSFAEEQFVRVCKGFRYSLFRQVFFMIKGKCYFLDFYIPDKNVAIEIDGSYHKNYIQSKKDKARDNAFLSIGIRTIRFTTEEMRDPDFKKLYYIPRLSGIGKKISPKNDITSHQSRILKAAEALQKCEKDSIIEFQSAYTAFLYAISHKDKPKEGARDLVALAEFYGTKKEKKIKVMVRYIGNRDNLTNGDKKRFEKWDILCDKEGEKSVVII